MHQLGRNAANIARTPTIILLKVARGICLTIKGTCSSKWGGTSWGYKAKYGSNLTYIRQGSYSKTVGHKLSLCTLIHTPGGNKLALVSSLWEFTMKVRMSRVLIGPMLSLDKDCGSGSCFLLFTLTCIYWIFLYCLFRQRLMEFVPMMRTVAYIFEEEIRLGSYDY